MSKTFIIAEIGINHNGSIDIAKDMILQCKNAGADSVKFQKRTINLVYSDEQLKKREKKSVGYNRKGAKRRS